MTETCSYILTLIASRQGCLTEQICKDSANLLGQDDVILSWLRNTTACDMLTTITDKAKADQVLRTYLSDHAIDFFIQKPQNRRKKLLLADMDSTIVTSETLDDLAAFAGLGEQISAITARAMNGELDFEAALNERVSMLKAMPKETLDLAYQLIKVMPGADVLVNTMTGNGAYCALVSGGFKFFTSRIKQRLGFDEDFSNDFIIENGQLTGEVVHPILGKAAKLETLHRLVNEHGITMSETLTVGDGANDLAMIQAAGLGVAYHGKPVVTAQATHRIDHGDLSALLYAQGYRFEDFVL